MYGLYSQQGLKIPDEPLNPKMKEDEGRHHNLPHNLNAP